MDLPPSEKAERGGTRTKTYHLGRFCTFTLVSLCFVLSYGLLVIHRLAFPPKVLTPAGSKPDPATNNRTVPVGFPSSGNGLWYTEPAVKWSTQYLPIGNGYLGAMVNGDPNLDRIQLNIESLWAGGPFADPSYNGGNHPSSQGRYLAEQLERIRNTIFTYGRIGDVWPMPSEAGDYGSYSGAGYLEIRRTATGKISDYARWLDLDAGVLKTVWSEPGSSFNRTYFCSNPTRACTVHTVSSSPGGLSSTFAFSPVVDSAPIQTSCIDNTTIQLRGRAESRGMVYEILATVQHSGPGHSTSGCALDPISGKAVLFVAGSTEAWVSWVGGTEYSMDSGNAAKSYSFKGVDPHASLLTLLTNIVTEGVGSGLSTHIADYQSALGGFSLDLGQTRDFARTTTELVEAYSAERGDPYLEWLLFNYGRYLLVSSTRSDLPANLQGKWGRDVRIIWGSDYHVNINTQMNYWVAEMTNTQVGSALWNYMEKTWAPRGAETARVLYNVTRGFVVHNEINIFGHSGMKAAYQSATWANYPESAAWMMIHVYDHFDYTGDVVWWRAQGWPLLKNVTSFWLDNLVQDNYFKDGSLVTAPCNSPEQGVITLGCAHSQQLIWQLFEAAEKGFGASGDQDKGFLREVQAKKLRIDKGVKIGRFGQLQEWKIDLDDPNDLHRHLSHLVGLYPGYVLANFQPPTRGSLANVTREQVLKATEVSLIARGIGTGPDADAGWEKIWRAACWAQLGKPTRFYNQLTYAIKRNFASNLFSVYDPLGANPIFQIDANLGYPAAVLNALVQAPDTSSLADPLRVTILPALPAAWNNGSITGIRIRGGITINMTWSNGKAGRVTAWVDPRVRHGRRVEIWYNGRVVLVFDAVGGYGLDLLF